MTSFSGLFSRAAFLLARTLAKREGTSRVERRRGEGNSFSFSFFSVVEKTKMEENYRTQADFYDCLKTLFSADFHQNSLTHPRTHFRSTKTAHKMPSLHVIFTKNTFSIASSRRQKSGKFPRGKKSALFGRAAVDRNKHARSTTFRRKSSTFCSIFKTHFSNNRSRKSVFLIFITKRTLALLHGTTAKMGDAKRK